jgi:hypothetical protein
MGASALMDHAGPKFGRKPLGHQPQGGRHGLVEGASTQAAPHDQQGQRTSALCGALGRTWEPGECGAYGVTQQGDPSPHRGSKTQTQQAPQHPATCPLKRLRKRFDDPTCNPCKAPIREPGYRILFVQDKRNTHQSGRCATGYGDIAPHSQNNLRAYPPQGLERLRHPSD